MTPKQTLPSSVEALAILAGRYPRLTEAEEKELGALAFAGSEHAQNQMVNHNIRLLIHVAKEQAGPAMDLEDVIGWMSVGLVKAAKSWDPSRGSKFSNYASMAMKHSLWPRLGKNGTRNIAVPVDSIRHLQEIRKRREELRYTLGRTPSRDELLKATGVTEEMYDSLMAQEAPMRRFGRGVNADGEAMEGLEARLADGRRLEAEEVLEEDDRKRLLALALAQLKPRDRAMVERYHGIGQEHGEGVSFTVVAREHGMTVEGARLAVVSARKKLLNGPYGEQLRAVWAA